METYACGVAKIMWRDGEVHAVVDKKTPRR